MVTSGELVVDEDDAIFGSGGEHRVNLVPSEWSVMQVPSGRYSILTLSSRVTKTCRMTDKVIDCKYETYYLSRHVVPKEVENMYMHIRHLHPAYSL